MHVLVTGATDVIGRQPVPRLLQAGHTVAGVARSDAAAGWLQAAGAWLARLVLGGVTGLFTVSQRVSNRRFRQTTGWRPRYPSVQAGWPTVAAPAGPGRRQVA